MKLVVIVGCVFVALTVYFHSGVHQTHYSAISQGQLTNFYIHKRPSIKNDPPAIDQRRNLRSDMQNVFHDSRKNIGKPVDSEPQPMGLVGQADFAHEPAKIVLPIDKPNGGENDADGDVKDSRVHKASQTSQTLETLLDKVEKLNLNSHNGRNSLMSNSVKNLNDKGNIHSFEVDDGIHVANAGQAEQELVAKNKIPRRKLNNDHHLLQPPEAIKGVPPLPLKKGREADIRIMPKRPAVPEGHSLMVTCADVMVLAKKTSSEEAMYMTFELPQSLSRKYKNTVHIIVRPGWIVCALNYLYVTSCTHTFTIPKGISVFSPA